MPTIKRRDLEELPEELQGRIREIAGPDRTVIYFPKPRTTTAGYRNAILLLGLETAERVRQFLSEEDAFFLDCKSEFCQRRNMKIRALYNMIKNDRDVDAVSYIAKEFSLSEDAVRKILGDEIYSETFPCPNGEDGG